MPIIKLILALALLAATFVCWLIILIEAFRDEIWKGIVGLLCGLYLIWFAIFDFDHDYKWLIVCGYVFGGSAVGLVLR